MDPTEPQPPSGEEETHTFTSQSLEFTDQTELAVWGMNYDNGEQQDFAYRVFAATPLPEVPQGSDPAEYAVRDVAAACGLPDLVFDAKKVPKAGGGTEEPTGDGIIICGKRGLILQSKNREGKLGDDDKETRWLNKHIIKGVGQARWVHGQLMSGPMELTNYRGRTAVIDGRDIDWTLLVVINHPRPPGSHIPDTSGAPNEPDVLVMTRRDWDFLYRHLWSNCAVIKYLNRERDDQLTLGQEPIRYAKYALDNLALKPEGIDDPAQAPSHDPLPGRELDPDSAPAHFVLREIMEYVALARFEGDVPERNRLALLALLDAVPTCFRTAVGERVLVCLNEARKGTVSDPISGLRVRWALDGRPFAVLIGAASERTEHLEQILEASADRCHAALKAQVGSEDVTTIALVLIPGRPAEPNGSMLIQVRGG